ncbi:mini-chromosome maintenance complex-binding protein-like isoform X2 [Mercenaria mercenaria]|uniref:mini-chromosome maintenance complex-binding protein-like isoform X2 n=1 Tax=Mercenaria mercenaria TaxID=6596 RepID=UPI00234F76B9|nr:mini-chromosome maintenance complex-binding protein-like isoform X2 [Mercenaria mercenaria]
MPSIEDWINNPLGIIQTLSDKPQDGDCSPVRKYFSEKLASRSALTWVPSLNDSSLHNLKANSLVRYRCMIQDMYDPEFYLGKYEVKDTATGNTFMRSGKYKDIAECGANQTIDMDSRNNVTMDRMTLYCVPVPGEAEWVKQSYADMSKVKTHSYPSTSTTRARGKRNLEDETEVSEEPMESQCPDAESKNGDNGAISMETEEEKSKRQQTARKVDGLCEKPDLNFPLPGEKGPACLVKVYDDIDKFKVNDIVEFVGVLSVDPSLARFQNDREEGDSVINVVEETPEEMNAHAPPPSLVPRLHAVLCNHLKHVNPLVPDSVEDKIQVLENIQGVLTALKQELLSVLEHALLGDKMAAKYLLCHLIANVYGRADAMALGKFSVNFSNCPRSSLYSELLHHLLSNIVTQSHLLHMSLENMNKLPFSPKKDYTANRLRSGILQLADQTNITINEIALEPGQLDVNGVKNIQSLGNVINWQKVEYDFEFHRQEFQSNISALIVSEGRSILPSDCFVPLQCKEQPSDLRSYFQQLDSILTDDFLTKCRTYIGLAKHMDYGLSDEVQKKIQDDFVSLRKDDPKSMTVDDFHALLSLTRLLSLSDLKSCPTLETWNMAKVMENCRKQRVAEIPERRT